MAGIHTTEFLLIFVIALLILGPKRIPEVANRVGGWVGKARRMTRILKRQLEEELDVEQGLNVRPKIKAYVPPNDDDTFSPLHNDGPSVSAEAVVDSAEPAIEPAQESPPDSGDATTSDDDGERREA